MLRTWAPGGVPMLRLGDRILKFVNIASIGWSYTGGVQSGFISVPEFAQYPLNTPQVFIVQGGFNFDGGPPQVVCNANGVNWAYNIADAEERFRVNTTFAYGFF